MFSEEELREISVLKRGDDYVEVLCGCTSHRYGDAVAKLRVCSSGELQIACDCTPGCPEDKLTPAAFEKHSGRETSRKWKNNIWILVDGDKVPVSATKNAGFVSAPRTNAGATMMLWPMSIGSALIFLLTNFHAMMMKNEQAGGCTGDVCVLRRVEVALPVCVLAVKYVVSQTAVARLALISQGMPKLEHHPFT
ncbi:uncharacterized protein LOC132029337 isoform X2 [Lycium ferocissimum]|uniref:uncharacterized protein LOC132029337 isoform X2 n=1 Tax=Lycium ferocissimum TaxID=112874 RepID=UPI0028164496|nr:uncharacterized protein LOC132029337 isoform X2 [Lycium ferocissimum]